MRVGEIGARRGKTFWMKEMGMQEKHFITRNHKPEIILFIPEIISSENYKLYSYLNLIKQ